jgi:DNA polymerase III epsilon subunit-like protein
VTIDYSKLAFVDTETLGLDVARHAVWEIAVIVDDTEHVWQVEMGQMDLRQADPVAMKINGFEARYDPAAAVSEYQSATMFAELTEGRHLVGAIISFDEERLRRVHTRRFGYPETGRFPWHYRLWCVESMAHALGYSGGLANIATFLGIEFDGATTHTALADARLAKAVYEEMMSR